MYVHFILYHVMVFENYPYEDAHHIFWYPVIDILWLVSFDWYPLIDILWLICPSVLIYCLISIEPYWVNDWYALIDMHWLICIDWYALIDIHWYALMDIDWWLISIDIDWYLQSKDISQWISINGHQSKDINQRISINGHQPCGGHLRKDNGGWGRGAELRLNVDLSMER